MAITSLLPWKQGEKKVAIQRAENPVYSLQQEMNRLFDDFFSADFGLTPFKGFGFSEGLGAFSPSIDVAENDKEIKISAELPGLSEDDIEVSLTGDTLTISGEKKAEKEDETKKWRKTNAVPEDERETRRGEEVNSKSKTLIFKGSCFMSIWTLTASPCYKHIYLYCFGIAVALTLGHGH